MIQRGTGMNGQFGESGGRVMGWDGEIPRKGWLKGVDDGPENVF